MTYQDALNTHLAEYARNAFQVTEPGVFMYRGQEHRYNHILPTRLWKLNLLEAARSPGAQYFAAHPGHKHRYFHHLNSSQAFAFNLFFPYFGGGGPAASCLLRALGQPGVLKEWKPEAIPDEDEGTNIDAWWTTTDGVETICEVKLSERNFGTARENPRRIQKITGPYSHRLRGHVPDAWLEPRAFLTRYQLLRNAWHCLDRATSRLLLLLPRANVTAWKHASDFAGELSPPLKLRIRIVAMEEVLEHLAAESASGDTLRSHATELRRKYIPKVT